MSLFVLEILQPTQANWMWQRRSKITSEQIINACLCTCIHKKSKCDQQKPKARSINHFALHVPVNCMRQSSSKITSEQIINSCVSIHMYSQESKAFDYRTRSEVTIACQPKDSAAVADSSSHPAFPLQTLTKLERERERERRRSSEWEWKTLTERAL